MKHELSTDVEGDGTTAKLCKWITRLDESQIPPSVLERAKYLILDGVGCGLVGAHVPWSQQCADAMKEFEPHGKCAVIGYDERYGPQTAALLNGAFIQATELDDYHSVAPLHSACAILPALFAAADCVRHNQPAEPSKVQDGAQVTTNGVNGHASPAKNSQLSGRQLLLATIAGFETSPRVGNGLHGAQMLSRGWHSGPIFGSPAAAAATSKLIGLDAEKTESAIGIACTQSGGLMSAQYEGMIKRMQNAFSARNGLFGALLARSGYVGIKKVFERPYGGFLAMFSQGCGKDPQFKINEVVKDLGKEWHTEIIRVKLHASCGGCHGYIECLQKLQARYQERFADDQLKSIKNITVGLAEPSYAHNGWPPEPRPMTATGAQMNVAFVGAIQMVDRQVLLAQFRESRLNRDEIWSLAEKTTAKHDPFFDRPHCGCGAQVRVEFDDGNVVEEMVEKPRGFEPPVTNAEILDKWRRLAASVIDEKRVAQIEALVLGLEDLGDVTKLTNLLGRPAGNALKD